MEPITLWSGGMESEIDPLMLKVESDTSLDEAIDQSIH
jgi:hypothetical protein